MSLRRLMLLAMFAATIATHVAHAARIFTNTQIPAASTNFDMGSVQPLTYAVTNTSTGGNVGERIYEMRFRISSGSLFSASTAAPAGWTRSAFSTTSVTFRANSWANAIAVGGAAVNFTLVIAMRTASADLTNERLRDMRASFTTTTTGPPFPRVGRDTTNTPGLWNLKSLAITSFQITDTGGLPITAQAAGNTFQVRMTVKNNSSAAQNPVVSFNNPPAGTWVPNRAPPPANPAPTCVAGGSLSLAAGASGTIIFSCSSTADASGVIFFSANAQRGGTVTSVVATSTSLAISNFTASVAASSSCLYAGASLTITMTINNNTGSTITAVSGTVTPVAVPSSPGAPVTFVSGPTPASIASIPNLGSATVTWVYTMTVAGSTNPFTFSGSATGTSGSLLTTPTATTSALTRGIFPATVNPTLTNAGSTNTEVTFTITNNGCASVNSVAVTAPVGWTFGGDAYSLVDVSAVSSIETWTSGGANPVTFTAPNIAGQMPLTFGGSFSLVYAATPPSATVSAFNLRITDASGAFTDVPLSITVAPYKTGTVNDAASKIWREDFK